MNRTWHKLILVAASAAAICASSALQAKDRSMDACIDSFISTRVAPGSAVKVIKRDSTPNRMGFLTPSTSTVEVTARDKRTGTDLGSAVCVVDRKGELISIDNKKPANRYAVNDAAKRTITG